MSMSGLIIDLSSYPVECTICGVNFEQPRSAPAFGIARYEDEVVPDNHPGEWAGAPVCECCFWIERGLHAKDPAALISFTEIARIRDSARVHDSAVMFLKAQRLERELVDSRRTQEYWKAEHHAANLEVARVEAVRCGLQQGAQPLRSCDTDTVSRLSTDAERLDWLEKSEAQLITHREKFGTGWTTWWNVVKRRKSISGHPLGRVRAAIDAAMAKKGKK